jgi:hypothetical protein
MPDVIITEFMDEAAVAGLSKTYDVTYHANLGAALDVFAREPVTAEAGSSSPMSPISS